MFRTSALISGLISTMLFVGLALVHCDAGRAPLVLHAERGEAIRTIPIDVGERFELDGQTLTVREIRPWRGLLRQSSGVALLHFAVRLPGGETIDDLILKSGDRITLNDDLTVTFAWHANEADAVAALRGTAPASRWGLREGDATSWTQSFVPGTGFEREDGTDVTLIEHGADGTIRVRCFTDGSVRTLTLKPGEQSPEGVMNASQPSSSDFVVVLGWPEGECMLVETHGGEATRHRFSSGGTVDVATGAIAVYDVQSDAVYVGPDQSPWLEATLEESSGRRVRVREGVTEGFQDWRLSLARNGG